MGGEGGYRRVVVQENWQSSRARNLFTEREIHFFVTLRTID